MSEKPVVANIQYGGEYKSQLEEAAKSGECIFCKLEFQAGMLFVADGWFVVHNEYPATDREGGKPAYQLLFVSIDHGDDEKPLSEIDHGAIAYLLTVCKDRFGFDGGGFFHRDGNPLVCGRTVRHPHAHYYVPRVVEDPPGSGNFRTVPIDIPVG